MGFDNLTPEQQERAKACTSTEEFVAFCEEEGITLSDEELKDMAAGAKCPHCRNACSMKYVSPCPDAKR